ncbi:MAG: adenine deaminase [bacterium]
MTILDQQAAGTERLAEFIGVARGDAPADLVLRGGKVVNVLSGEVQETSVAIHRGRIAGLGDYEGREIQELEGLFLSPGFIDAHCHIESSMTPPAEYARAVVPRGTTTVVADPHEIANVLGLEGIRFLLESSRHCPLDVFLMAPSCVPASHLETAGAKLEAEDLSPLLRDGRILGLGEMMNYPGVVAGDPGVLAKLELAAGSASANAVRVDGHAPGLTGRALCAYVAAGVQSDHECVTAEEAREKLRLGMHIMIREGSTARNLEALLPVVRPENAGRFSLVTDDVDPVDLSSKGHLDHVLNEAIRLGLDPLVALQMVTVNSARYFGLADRGAIAPGFRADLAVFDDLRRIRVRKVFKDGSLVASEGRMAFYGDHVPSGRVRNTVSLRWDRLEDLSVAASGRTLRVIGVEPGQIVTRSLLMEARVEDGLAVADVKRDILKMAVAERHGRTGQVGIGFVHGFGLKGGALASSVAHDSHNVVVAGVEDDDLRAGFRAVEEMQGGLAVIRDGRAVAQLPLPIAGLMSESPIEAVTRELEGLHAAAGELGCDLPSPFMALSFLALAVIPELKLTDLGLVDVTKFDFVPLFADEA